jgi:intracellular sulfur oxidation DsrE/DsrF family protein
MEHTPAFATTTRSGFLAGSLMTGAVLGGVAAAQAATGYDNAAMERVLARPARHRQVIAAPQMSRGTALRLAGNTLNAFQFALGGGPGAVHTICVFYGSSIFYVMNDSVWSTYRVFDVLDGAGDGLPLMVHEPRNPFLHARSNLRASDAPDDRNGFYHDFSIEALTRRGVTWFVCDNALHTGAEQIGRFEHVDPGTVYADLRAGLAPGSIVVPAGVAAIVLAQEARFALQPA